MAALAHEDLGTAADADTALPGVFHPNALEPLDIVNGEETNKFPSVVSLALDLGYAYET